MKSEIQKTSKGPPIIFATLPIIALKQSGTSTTPISVAYVKPGWRKRRRKKIRPEEGDDGDTSHDEPAASNIAALLASKMNLTSDNDVVKDLIAEAINASTALE